MSSYLYRDVDFGFGVFILSKTGKQINIATLKELSQIVHYYLNFLQLIRN